jgi:hypothetical protein
MQMAKQYSQAEKNAWMQARLAAERARGIRGSVKPLPEPSALSKSIAKGLSRGLPKATAPTPAPPKAGHNRRPLVAPAADSECFSDLRYSPTAGGVFATFRRDQSQYFYPMDRGEAREWFGDESLGKFFNAEVR